MVLVDTSVWVDYFSVHPSDAVLRLDELIKSGQPFALAPIILQEILQGARSKREFDRLAANLLTQRFLFPRDDLASAAAAADIYFRCRRSGVTPRGAIDCLIVQIAIDNEAALLHNDRDFVRMAHFVPELVLF